MVDGEIDGSMYGATYPSIYGSENGARNNNPSGRIINSGGRIYVGPLVPGVPIDPRCSYGGPGGLPQPLGYQMF